MKKDITIHIAMMLVALTMFAACQSYDDDRQDDGRDANQMTVELRIPAADGSTTRTPGDPLYYADQVALPVKLYLYVVTETTEGQKYITPKEYDLKAEAWVKMEVPWQGSTQTVGDSYYYYPDLTIILPAEIPTNGRKAIRIYAVATPIAFAAKDDIAEGRTANTEDDVIGMKVTLAENSEAPEGHRYDYIKDIYSSPYDYILGTAYYGTASNPKSSNPQVTMMLYHTAARVDVMWNVDATVQQQVRLTQIEFRNLRKTGCHVFGYTPADNSTDGYTVSVPQMDVSNQWYGRHYFYAMPCVDGVDDDKKYPLQIHLWQNDEDLTGDGHAITLQVPFNRFVGQSMAPWVREDVIIKKVLP